MDRNADVLPSRCCAKVSLDNRITQRGNAVSNVHVRLHRAELSRSFACLTEGFSFRPRYVWSGCGCSLREGHGRGAAAQTTTTCL